MGIETKYYTNANEPKSLGLASAAVGQIPKVKAVDSNGVPIEWEATAMPSGGAGSMKKLTFTGAATGEYDGAADVSIDIPDSDIYKLILDKDSSGNNIITNDFEEVYQASQNKMMCAGGQIVSGYTVDRSSGVATFYIKVNTNYYYCIKWDSSSKRCTIEPVQFPMFDSSTLGQNSGSICWDKTNNKFIIKDISSASGSSDYVINVTLDTKQSSIGNWVLGYSCTCDKTYAEVLAAYQSGAKVIAHVTRNKEITLTDGSKKTIPIINEAPLTRYIAAQNLLVFDYVHNATDLSVSSGGLTYTTGDTGDSMICYVATYQFAFGATDTSADSVQIPTTTKVQDMIDASVGDINTNTYTIQVSNTAPAAGTSDKIITYVVEEAAAGSKNSLVEQ